MPSYSVPVVASNDRMSGSWQERESVSDSSLCLNPESSRNEENPRILGDTYVSSRMNLLSEITGTSVMHLLSQNASVSVAQSQKKLLENSSSLHSVPISAKSVMIGPPPKQFQGEGSPHPAVTREELECAVKINEVTGKRLASLILVQEPDLLPQAKGDEYGRKQFLTSPLPPLAGVIRLNDRFFRIIEKLGQGGQGFVYKVMELPKSCRTELGIQSGYPFGEKNLADNTESALTFADRLHFGHFTSQPREREVERQNPTATFNERYGRNMSAPPASENLYDEDLEPVYYAIKVSVSVSEDELEEVQNEIRIQKLFRGEKRIIQLLDTQTVCSPKSSQLLQQDREQEYESSSKRKVPHFVTLSLLEIAETSMQKFLFPTRKHYIEGRTRQMAEKEIKMNFEDMARALEAVHNRGIIHLDVKLDNFLISPKTPTISDSRSYCVKLCDFGLARRIRRISDPEYDIWHISSTHIPLASLNSTGSQILLKSRVGTAKYMAPEVFWHPELREENGRLHVSEKCDVWSLGVCFYLILFGKYPHCNPNSTYVDIVGAVGDSRVSFRYPSWHGWLTGENRGSTDQVSVASSHTSEVPEMLLYGVLVQLTKLCLERKCELRISCSRLANILVDISSKRGKLKKLKMILDMAESEKRRSSDPLDAEKGGCLYWVTRENNLLFKLVIASLLAIGLLIGLHLGPPLANLSTAKDDFMAVSGTGGEESEEIVRPPGNSVEKIPVDETPGNSIEKIWDPSRGVGNKHFLRNVGLNVVYGAFIGSMTTAAALHFFQRAPTPTQTRNTSPLFPVKNTTNKGFMGTVLSGTSPLSGTSVRRLGQVAGLAAAGVAKVVFTGQRKRALSKKTPIEEEASSALIAQSPSGSNRLPSPTSLMSSPAFAERHPTSCPPIICCANPEPDISASFSGSQRSDPPGLTPISLSRYDPCYEPCPRPATCPPDTPARMHTDKRRSHVVASQFLSSHQCLPITEAVSSDSEPPSAGSARGSSEGISSRASESGPFGSLPSDDTRPFFTTSTRVGQDLRSEGRFSGASESGQPDILPLDSNDGSGKEDADLVHPQPSAGNVESFLHVIEQVAFDETRVDVFGNLRVIVEAESPVNSARVINEDESAGNSATPAPQVPFAISLGDLPSQQTGATAPGNNEAESVTSNAEFPVFKG